MRDAATASSAASAGFAGARVEAAVAAAREARPVIQERLEGSAGWREGEGKRRMRRFARLVRKKRRKVVRC